MRRSREEGRRQTRPRSNPRIIVARRPVAQAIWPVWEAGVWLSGMTRHTTARAFLDCAPVAGAAWPSRDTLARRWRSGAIALRDLIPAGGIPVKITRAVAAVALIGVIIFVWLAGSSNPVSPAGYVGYLTQGAVFGKTRFYGLQTG